MAADAASAAFAVIKEKMPSAADPDKRIVIATVRGDLHDIGKNIVRVLLENFGFYVEDLGRDVPPETVAEAAKGCRLVGLSALMTTTVPAMEETIRLVHEVSPGTRVMVGGAVLTEEYAARIGADFMPPTRWVRSGSRKPSSANKRRGSALLRSDLLRRGICRREGGAIRIIGRPAVTPSDCVARSATGISTERNR